MNAHLLSYEKVTLQ